MKVEDFTIQSEEQWHRVTALWRYADAAEVAVNEACQYFTKMRTCPGWNDALEKMHIALKAARAQLVRRASWEE